jgi:hypothetical protein
LYIVIFSKRDERVLPATLLDMSTSRAMARFASFPLRRRSSHIFLAMYRFQIVVIDDFVALFAHVRAGII